MLILWNFIIKMGAIYLNIARYSAIFNMPGAYGMGIVIVTRS